MQRLRWAVILAGGNGTRLHAFTKSLTGDDRPKQFCKLLGNQTLLEATRARVASFVPADQTISVVTAHHAPYYRHDLASIPQQLLIEQPIGRGTAPAIAYAIARVARLAPDAVVGLFPADHHYEDAAILRQAASRAYAAAAVDRERVFLIGAIPDRAETDYGYIQPMPLAGSPHDLHVRGVAAFIEKPAHAEALGLVARGCLWNTFVLVGHVGAFASLFESTLPGLYDSFTAVADDDRLALSLYATLAPSDFSQDVLARRPERLGLLSLGSGNWTDLGQPSRVLEVMASSQRTPVGRSLVAS